MHIVPRQLPQKLKILFISARNLKGKDQPVAAGVKQTKTFKIGQNRPGAVVFKSIVNRLLLFLSAVSRHARQGHLPRAHRPFTRQFINDAKTFRLNKNFVAIVQIEDAINPSAINDRFFTPVFGNIFNRPAKYIAEKTFDEDKHIAFAG